MVEGVLASLGTDFRRTASHKGAGTVIDIKPDVEDQTAGNRVDQYFDRQMRVLCELLNIR